MIQAKILAYSKGHNNTELITFIATFPRIILAELNTHRMFSRNSASSRAIPFSKMVESVQNNPFIPIAFQKEHKGMQGTEYITDNLELVQALLAWKNGVWNAIDHAKNLSAASVTKQLANRLLEPFMWHTCIITTSKQGLDNFFDLRCPQYNIGDDNIYKSRVNAIQSIKDKGIDTDIGEIFISDLDWLLANEGKAEIHMMALAEAMYDAYNESIPEILGNGEWHIPYKYQIEREFGLTNCWVYDSHDLIPNIVYISSVMCARVSYTVSGHELTDWTGNKYLAKAHELIDARPLHASPFEHCAQRMTRGEYELDYTGNRQKEDGWCRNFQGFIQLRHHLEANK